jgi:dihydroorotase
VEKTDLLYQCGWSPFEGTTFKGSIEKTLLNGQWAYDQGKINPKSAAMALTFDR